MIDDDDIFVESIVEMLIKEVFRIYELFTLIMFDRGSQFVVIVWKSFCKRLDIEVKLSTVFYLKIDDQIERSNQDLKRYLRIYCNHMQDDWVKWIFMIEFADNNNVFAFMSVSPFYANKGFHSRMSFNSDTIDYVIIRKRFDVLKIKDIIEHMQNVFVYIRENLNKTQLVMIE